MFPSTNDGLFGIFVKNFKIELEKQGVVFSKIALIKGQASSPIKKVTNYIAHYLRIVRSFFSGKYDLMYVHYVLHHIPILLVLLPFKNKPWVLNAHGNDMVSLQKNTFLNFFAAILLRKIDLLVVPSGYLKNEVLKNYPFLTKEKVFVSPSGGIDPKKFYHKNLTPHTCLPARKASNLTPLSLGFVARFTKEKGWKTFLDALLLLKKDKLAFQAVMAGKGPEENKIKAYIQTHGLEEVIDFRGFVKQKKLVDLYNQLDLYIFPTESDSLGLTGVEAMACGTPIIACKIAGPGTYVEHGKNGFLFEPRNPTELAGLIKEYVVLSELEKNKFKENALETASQFEQSHVAKLLLKRLESLTNTAF